LTHGADAGTQPGALVVRRIIHASREEIFDMWTRAENLRRWMRPPRASGASAESDPRVGGRYRIVMHGDRDYDHHGEYLVVDRPSKLSFTWISEGSRYQTSVVTVEFFDRGSGQTELVLTHERLPEEEIGRHIEGWTEILGELAAAVDARQG
jgi:uncharacterized protein YndB with AHSA1/START domain